MNFRSEKSGRLRALAAFALLSGGGMAHAEQYWYAIANTEAATAAAATLTLDYQIELGTERLLASPTALELFDQPTLRLLAKHESPILINQIYTLGHSCSAYDHPLVSAIVGGFDVVIQNRDALTIHPLLQAIPADHSVAKLYDVGLQRKATRSSVQALVSQVDADRWFASLAELSSINRNSYSPALDQARTLIAENFMEAGLSVSSYAFTLSNITSCTPTPAPVQLPNVIGTKVGLLRPNEWIVIGAHYDSRNPSRCDGTANPQPGANDNASGCAGVMELARVFSGVQTDRSMLFMCFSGEEQGLVGSRRYVDSLVASGEISKVKLMLNMDMIGHDVDGTLPARIETRTATVMSAFTAAAASYAPELRIITSTTPNSGSDHFYFQQANVPAVVTWENGASVYPHYHQVSDIPANMTRAREMAAGILKMNTAALYDQALVIDPDSLLRSGFE
jgi:Peptidase family M28